MKKRKIFILFASIFIFILPMNYTYGKYNSTIIGEAWKTAFTTFEIVKDTYVVSNDDLTINPDTNKKEGLSESFWGIENGESGEDYRLDTLQNVEFSVQNMSSTRLKVMFDVVYNAAIGGISDIFIRSFTFSIKNTTTNHMLEGNASINNGADIKINTEGNNRHATIDPELLATTDEKKQIFESSFIVNTGESATFNMSIDGWSAISQYVSVKIYVQEY